MVLTATFEMENFSEKTNFDLWKVKMRALLVQQGVNALLGDVGFEKDVDAKEKVSIMERVHSTLILSLGDKALREVTKEKTAKDIWDKMESLYNVKYNSNKLYLKKKLFGFKIVPDRSLSDQLQDYAKISTDLEGVEVILSDEDKALMLINALPDSYENFY